METISCNLSELGSVLGGRGEERRAPGTSHLVGKHQEDQAWPRSSMGGRVRWMCAAVVPRPARRAADGVQEDPFIDLQSSQDRGQRRWQNSGGVR